MNRQEPVFTRGVLCTNVTNALSGPGGEGGGAAARCGADQAVGPRRHRHPAGREDEPVRQPAGVPGQPVHGHQLPA